MGRKSRSKQEGGMNLARLAVAAALSYDDNNNILRLIADIKKDSIASINTVKQATFKNLLNKLFTPSTIRLKNNITKISFGSTQFIEVLHEVEQSTEVDGEEDIQLNILASDLVHACASDAIYVFPETGLSPSKAVTDPKFVIGTAAGYLDPGSGSTEINCLYAPSEPIHFNEKTLRDVGFPAKMNWVCKQTPALAAEQAAALAAAQTEEQAAPLQANLLPINPSTTTPIDCYDIEIKYPYTVLGASDIATGGILSNGAFAPRSNLQKLCLGNAEKNENIENSRLSDGFEIDEGNKINLLLTKELGDVAQVLVYDDFVKKLKASIIARQIYIQELDAEVATNPRLGADPNADAADIISRQKSVMITTDHVVYMLCKEKNLSCIYTGAQKLSGIARESGHTHIVTYTGVILSEEEKRARNINLHITNLIKYLQNKKFLINLLLTEHSTSDKSLKIMIFDRRGTLTQIQAKGYNLRKEHNYEAIYGYLNGVLDKINVELENINQEIASGHQALIGIPDVNPYFLAKKQEYDADYDLITYNKQTREFIATDTFNKYIKANQIITMTGGAQPAHSSDPDPIFAETTITEPTIDQVINNIRYEYSELFNGIETINKDHKITFESALLIHFVDYTIRKNDCFRILEPPEEALNLFSALYDYYLRYPPYDFAYPNFLSEIPPSRFIKNYDDLYNLIIFTGQQRAEIMGFYSQDYDGDIVKIINPDVFLNVRKSEAVNYKNLEEVAAAEAVEAAEVEAAAEAEAKIEMQLVLQKEAEDEEQAQVEMYLKSKENRGMFPSNFNNEPPNATGNRKNPPPAPLSSRSSRSSFLDPRAAAHARQSKRRGRVKGGGGNNNIYKGPHPPVLGGGTRKTKRKRRRNRKDKNKKTHTLNRNNSLAKSSKKRTVKVSKRKSKTQQPKASE